ncbi:MAG: DUF87 domain-containing protein [Planctomycetaceae bacterium]|nr:DUF87 domain-containing protein [Planctomycetaceae bacterium]
MGDTIKIGSANGEALALNVARLVDTRMLIQANSGGGKSWLLRLIAEQTMGYVPTIVLDPEGEFFTLREKCDLVLVGREGEIPTDVRSAALLARKLVELSVSAVIDLYDLRLPDRRRFVKLFLESLLALPRALWGPRLILIDEAHLFAPERAAGEAESLGAVIDLASQGRKRGYGCVLSTQRLSKLHKDAAAELNNVAIGRTWLDLDQQRAGDLLGMSKQERGGLRELGEGNWFAFGPAFSQLGVVRFKSGAVKTKHPSPGDRHKLKPPAPSTAIKGVVSQLTDLPAAAEAEVKSLEEAKKRLRELERQLKGKPVAIDQGAIDRACQAAAESARRDLERLWQKKHQAVDRQYAQVCKSLANIHELSKAPEQAAAVAPVFATSTPRPVPLLSNAVMRRPVNPPTSVPPANGHAATADGVKLGKCERATLRACFWLRNEAATKAKIAFYAGYSIKSSGFDNALSSLRTAGLLEGFMITEAGIEAAGEPGDKPTGDQLREWLRPKLGRCENAVLDALIGGGGNPLSNAEIAEAAGYSTGSSGFDNALSTLRTLEAAEGYERTGGTRAADVFFE